MRKQNLLILLLLCLSVSLLKASAESKTMFPGCSVSVSISPSGISTTTICLGGSVSLVATATGGLPPYTYSWSPATGLNNPNIANPIATPTVTTNYTVNVTDHLGCTGSASLTITVNQPPVANPDTILFEYITGRTLTAKGGVPPYTYTFSPSVNTNSLLSLPITNTTYTITITGANGCSSTQYANYVPLNNIESCTSVYISEYIQDTALSSMGGMTNAVELYNPTASPINLNTYYLTGTTNGSLLSPPFIIQLHGILCPHRTFLIANKNAESSLTSRANMLSDSLNFNGRDIVALAQACVVSNNLNFSFLDKIGSLSPFATDSGWAVPFGSTKNHTLERRSNVMQGNLNWATAKYEWNPYPQGNLSHIGRYRSVCTAGAPDLTFTFDNAQTTCDGSSHYFEFDIMASSDQPSWFDNCIMWLIYNPTAFGTDVVSGGNVTVTAYSNFSPPTYINPQVNIGDIGSDTLGIGFGTDPSQVTFSRTQIDATPQQMLHIKMKVLSCGYSSDISFADTGDLQIWSWYTVNQNDTNNTQMSYNYTYYTGGLNNNTCQMAITNFNLPIDAGVGDILTITGSDFGNTRGSGQVKFFDADTANYRIQRLNNIDYISWTDNQIQIRLPGFADSAFHNLGTDLTVGGGNFVVKNSCGDSVISGNNTNGQPFSVYYNINQYWNLYLTPYQKKEICLMNTNANGGYLLRFDSVTFPKGSLKRLIFQKAMRDWTCYTGMNWTVGKDTSYNYIGNYRGINYVFFSPSYLSHSTVAETYINPDECADSIDILKGAVTCFNSDTSFIRFKYDTTGSISIPAGYFDFYGVCLHELGHFIELGHTTDPTTLMYWTANEGPISASNRITLGTAAAAPAVDGGLYSVLHSISLSDICDGFSAMVGENTSCINPTSIYNIQKPQIDFSLYPNPSKGTFTLQSSINDYTLVVINMLGQRIITKKIENEKTSIDVSTLPNGMYFIQEQYINGMSTQKLIISK